MTSYVVAERRVEKQAALQSSTNTLIHADLLTLPRQGINQTLATEHSEYDGGVYF